MFVFAVGALALAAQSARAQQPRRGWEPRGFDFTPEGVWRHKARQIAQLRQQALARGDFSLLNRAIGVARTSPNAFATPVAGSATSVTGVLRIPAILVRYKNTTSVRQPASYDSVLFGITPPSGRPYTVRTFYEEMSHGLLSVQGVVIGWVQLDSNEAYYTGAGTCDGLCGSAHVQKLIQEAIVHADSTVDMRQFDNDGPDGVANSGDDDGQVDLLWLVHPTIGAECGVDGHIWAHRYSYTGWGPFGVQPLATNDLGQNGTPIKVENYTIQSGLGGTLCDQNAIMPPGTIAHETGHGLGLPDLYDVNPSDGDDNEGIGEWGLMGSGNYARPLSPAHMEAFSLQLLGWITTVPLGANGSYTLGAIEIGDTAFIVNPPAGISNPRTEYFMLENRQAQRSDTALINKKGGGGLLIWHVDMTKYNQCAFPNNCVNTGSIHGLALMQADGLNQLGSSVAGVRNRGDGGDPYPGTTANTVFGVGTNPAVTLNTTGNPFAGFVVDSIRQIISNGKMGFRLRFGGLTVVRAADTTALIKVHGASYAVFRDVLDNGDTATISMDSSQFRSGGRSEYLWSSWSDGGARTHQISGVLSGVTVTATLTARHKVQVATTGTGTVTPSPSIDIVNGTFVSAGTTVTLTAAPGPGMGFAGWSGDTTAAGTQLTLGMQRPYTVTATFQPLLVAADTALRAPVMGSDYADTLRVSGGVGSYVYALLSGQLPPGLALSADGVVSGVASRDSSFDAVVRATSGNQTLDLPIRMHVTAPALVLANVINQYLNGGTALTADERRYLDLNGNQNNLLDVGDLVAWLDKTGAAVSASVMSRILRRSP